MAKAFGFCRHADTREHGIGQLVNTITQYVDCPSVRDVVESRGGGGGSVQCAFPRNDSDKELASVRHVGVLDDGTTALGGESKIKGMQFSLFHINSQCLRNKVGLFGRLLDELRPSIFCVSEHWLVGAEIEELSIDGYTMIDAFCRNGCIHGGTGIYVCDSLAKDSKCLKFYTKKSVEMSFECSSIVFKNYICVITLYRSQVGDLDIFYNLLSDVLADFMARSYPYIIICGDLNIDGLVNSKELDALNDVLGSYNLRILVKEPTRIVRNPDGSLTCSLLDYIITNISPEMIESCVVFDPAVSDHHAQLFKWRMQADLLSGHGGDSYRVITTRSINGIGVAMFKRLFTGTGGWFVNFMNALQNRDVEVDGCFESFWEHFTWCLDAACPNIKKRIPCNTQVRYKHSDSIKEQISQLRELNYMKKFTYSVYLNCLYKYRKKLLNDQIILERQLFHSNIINSSNNISRTTWRLVNDSRRASGGRADSKRVNEIQLYFNNKLVSDKSELAGLFGEYFSSVVGEKLTCHFGTNLSVNCTKSGHAVAGSMCVPPVGGEEVRRVIDSLQGGRSTGGDGVTVYFVKQCADVLSEVIAALINLSINCGTFPSRLKLSSVVPVPKKGDPCDIANFRPISLISIFSKIVERIISEKIVSFLEKNNTLSGCQHGFRRSRSTETATTHFTQYIYDKIDQGEYVISVFFDLSRAFDTLHPGFVSEKIAVYGLRGKINDLIVSYLTDRKFSVKVDDRHSDVYTTETGTPQGSVLGPLIFLLYVNDLPEHIGEGRSFMYADDTTIVVSDADPGVVCRRLETVLVQFKAWCDKNRLIVNIDKTTYMQFRSITRPIASKHLDGNIALSETVRFLGTVVDSQLTWQHHIDYVAGKLNSAHYAISSMKNRFNTQTLLTVYYAIFYPHLCYNIAAWGLSTHCNRLFILQKRVVRLIFGLEYRESCRSTFKSQRILTVTCIYLYKVLTYIHINRQTFSTHSDVHEHNTRGRFNICQNRHNHTYYEKSPIYAGVRFYNMLPECIKATDQLFSFKKRLKEFLLEGSCYDVGEFVGFVGHRS